MSNDQADAAKLFTEHDDKECTVIIFGQDVWHDTQVLPSLREAARYARENSSNQTPRVEITVHTKDGEEKIYGRMPQVLMEQA